MRTILTLILMLFIAGTAHAQKEITKYFDENWYEVSSAKDASYYRVAYKTEDKLWKVNDYYMSGVLQMTGTYRSKREKKKQGKFIYYNENGKIASEGNYHKDEKTGEWQYYYDNGELKSRIAYKNGNKVSEAGFYRNGNKSHIGEFWQSGIKTGLWKFWNDKGHLYMEGKFRMGRKDGKWNRYFPDGTGMKVKFEGGVPKEKNFGGMIKRNQVR